MNDMVVFISFSVDSIVLFILLVQDFGSLYNFFSGEFIYCMFQNVGDFFFLDGDYDYDQDDYEDGVIIFGSSVIFFNFYGSQWFFDYCCFMGIYNSLGVYWFSFEGVQFLFEDSEEDFDFRFDIDDEFLYWCDFVYSCVILLYFYSFLYMKGGLMNFWKCCWCVFKDEIFLWFCFKQEVFK